jgi:hypothetical protein
VAVRALPPGTARRRAFFGLLDANGWTWATLKALFWFVVLIVLLGYIPDRAYYFTVFPTIDVGANVISPVNLCPGSNNGLDCPAPPGSVVPWQASPQEIALPEGRTQSATAQSGTNLYLVGGRVGDAPTESVLMTQVSASGNFGPWTEAPALPEPRADAATVSFGGVPYVIGGYGPDDQPTATVFRGTVEQGSLTGWEEVPELALPEPVADAAGVTTATALWVIGGTTADGPTPNIVRAVLPEDGNEFGAWEAVANLPLPQPRTGASAATVGSHLYVVGGGQAANSPATEIFRIRLDADGNPVGDGEQPPGWFTSTGGQNLPEARSDPAVFSANSGLYVVGGRDPNGGAARTNFWSIPNADSGDFPEWQRSDRTDLPGGRVDPAEAVIGSFVFLIGGEGEGGVAPDSLRADLAPQPPFFRLGLFGATIPALGIEGEIGQQLGYLIAAGVGTGNFVALILIGLAFSHKRTTQRILERVTRGRYRAPRDSEYFD